MLTKNPKTDAQKEKKAEAAKQAPDDARAGDPKQRTGGADAPSPPAAAAQNEVQAALKDIESALFAVKFYPVAVDEKSKKEAVARLETLYTKGNDTVRQLLLYMIHELIATSVELKVMHTYEYFKAKNPAQDPAQVRIQVYRAMFNYNTSLEGLIEVIRFLGRLKGGDDAAKLLTYHFSHLCAAENEASHMIRAAILEALGESESQYALRALLEYAQYTDSERSFNRIVSALTDWEEKVGSLEIPDSEKEYIRGRLKEIITSDFGGSHYG